MNPERKVVAQQESERRLAMIVAALFHGVNVMVRLSKLKITYRSLRPADHNDIGLLGGSAVEMSVDATVGDSEPDSRRGMEFHGVSYVDQTSEGPRHVLRIRLSRKGSSTTWHYDRAFDGSYPNLSDEQFSALLALLPVEFTRLCLFGDSTVTVSEQVRPLSAVMEWFLPPNQR